MMYCYDVIMMHCALYKFDCTTYIKTKTLKEPQGIFFLIIYTNRVKINHQCTVKKTNVS